MERAARARPRGVPQACRGGKVTDCAHWARIAVASPHVTEWERTFCASIIAKANRRGFRPSEKQARALENIRRKIMEMARDDDAPLIERGENAG
jgi:hypothetical protein